MFEKVSLLLSIAVIAEVFRTGFRKRYEKEVVIIVSTITLMIAYVVMIFPLKYIDSLYMVIIEGREGSMVSIEGVVALYVLLSIFFWRLICELRGYMEKLIWWIVAKVNKHPQVSSDRIGVYNGPNYCPECGVKVRPGANPKHKHSCNRNMSLAGCNHTFYRNLGEEECYHCGASSPFKEEMEK